MAKPKKSAKPTKAKPARAKPAKAKPAKAKPAKAKPAKAKPAKSAAALSPIEAEVARLLADYDAGNIDNAWDVLPRMVELDDLLPKSSKLWKAYNRMSTDIGEIARQSAMGDD